MRRVPGPARAPAAPNARPAGRARGATIRKVAGGGTLVLLLVLLYLIMYQNLPGDLNGMKFKPINTAGPIDQAVKLGAILVGAAVIAARWSLVHSLAKNMNLGLLAFMVLAPMSIVWSIDPNATMLRCLTLLGIVLLCVGISLVGWNQNRFLQVAMPPMMVIFIASLIYGMLYPDKIIQLGEDISQKNAWHGITYNKNQFGMTASIGAILCFHRWLAQRKGAIWSLAGLVISIVCVLLSRSSTSLLATMICTTFVVLMMRVPLVKQRFSTHVVVGLAALIIVYELVIMDVIPGVGTLLAPVMSITGKDTTFSSRGLIWSIVKEHSSYAPLLGSGYAAYWPTMPTPDSPSYIFMRVMYFYPQESHNGYLEILNDLGVVGLACVALFLISYIRQALQLMRFNRAQAVMYLALLFEQMVANLSESEWFSRSTVCIILLLGTTCLSRELLEYRRLAGQSSRS